MNIFGKIKEYIASRGCHVILDPTDNSVTLSKKLFQHICNNAMGKAEPKVFVFSISNEHAYGFMVNPEIKQETCLCSIQYNEKYQTVGFETLCPPVTRILYDYQLEAEKKYKLSVKVKTINSKSYYKIIPPITPPQLKKRKDND